jgi:hypothetical protein
MTREEAAEKINEFRRSRTGDNRGGAQNPRQGDGQQNPDEIYRRAAGEIRAAIGAGRITPEQGRERLEALRERIGAREGNRERDGDRESNQPPPRRGR